MKPLEMLVEAAIKVEKLRVQTQVRQSHLTRNERHDDLTDELLERTNDLEKWIDKKVAKLILTHPAYPWFSKVKGIGKENIGKVVAQVDIEKATTISALWKYAGFSVDNGKAPKRTKGEKLSYNSELRSMCWRVGKSLIMAQGRFYDYYKSQKERYVQRYTAEGISIVPTAALPKKSGKTYEPEGKISEGHVHNQAMRKMIKLFLACLWLVWREQEGLPTTKPYAIDILAHDSFIEPWDMADESILVEVV